MLSTACPLSDREARTATRPREGWCESPATRVAAPNPSDPSRPHAGARPSRHGPAPRHGPDQDRSPPARALPRSATRLSTGSRSTRATVRPPRDRPQCASPRRSPQRSADPADSEDPVPRRPPRVEPRHRRRRSATPSSIQQHRLHHALLGLNDNATIVPAAPHESNDRPPRRSPRSRERTGAEPCCGGLASCRARIGSGRPFHRLECLRRPSGSDLCAVYDLPRVASSRRFADSRAMRGTGS
jgi:hypothetical protein